MDARGDINAPVHLQSVDTSATVALTIRVRVIVRRGVCIVILATSGFMAYHGDISAILCTVKLVIILKIAILRVHRTSDSASSFLHFATASLLAKKELCTLLGI